MNTIHDLEPASDQDRADIAVAFQTAVVDTIRIKCERALEHTGLRTLVVAGGVSANVELREKLRVVEKKLSCEIHYPAADLCTDNGAMIAYAGFERISSGQTEDLSINVRPRWPMTELPGMGRNQVPNP